MLLTLTSFLTCLHVGLPEQSPLRRNNRTGENLLKSRNGLGLTIWSVKMRLIKDGMGRKKWEKDHKIRHQKWKMGSCLIYQFKNLVYLIFFIKSIFKELVKEWHQNIKNGGGITTRNQRGHWEGFHSVSYQFCGATMVICSSYSDMLSTSSLLLNCANYYYTNSLI